LKLFCSFPEVLARKFYEKPSGALRVQVQRLRATPLRRVLGILILRKDAG